MNWAAHDVADTFKLFKQRLLLVCEDNEVTNNEKIAGKIKIGLGDEGLRRLNASGLTDDDQKDTAKLWELFETQLKVAVNFRIQRLSLMQYRQKSDESLDEFVTRARAQAQLCEFTEKEMQDRIIELVIAGTRMEIVRRELLGKDKDLTLHDVLTEGRRHEAAALGTDRLKSLHEGISHSVDHVTTGKKRCKNCALYHEYRQCPAYRDTCKGCGRKGHWQQQCPAYRDTCKACGRRGTGNSNVLRTEIPVKLVAAGALATAMPCVQRYL